MAKRTTSVRRRTGSREVSNRILIMCDGESEVTYFEKLGKLYDISNLKAVEHGCSGADVILRKTKMAVEQDRKRMSRSNAPSDRIAIVTDLDGNRTPKCELDTLMKGCRENNFELYISNQCFEVWLINHYKKATTPMSAKEAVEELDSCTKGYKKSSGIAFDRDMVTIAIRNSKESLDVEDAERCYGSNPSTMVCFLVESLIKLPE